MFKSALFWIDVIGFTALLAVGSTQVYGDNKDIKVEPADRREVTERNVDSAALSALESSQSKLTSLLKKYRNTSQEPIFLQKLAELQQQNASIQFRLAHGAAHHGKTAINLNSYKATMRQTIATLTELFRKYPHTDGLAPSYYMRGKAYEEIGDNKSATNDYLHLTSHYPEADETPAAFMALAEFAITANDHALAITYLNEVEKRPETSHYPFALYKLAWAHYNLKNIPKSLSYAERNIAYYNERRKPVEKGTDSGAFSSDDALLENILMDSMVFFFEGYEEKIANYKVGEALPYIHKLEKGPIAGKMLARFAKLLRSHGYEADLVTWKNQVLEEEYFRPEALDVLITTFESQINKRRYPELAQSTRDLVSLYKKVKGKYSFNKAHKILLDTAESFQELILKNKGSSGVAQLSTTLASVYDVFTQVVDETDPRIPEVHYNLAETLFEIKDYEQATTHYRWVVEHQNWGSWNKELKAGNVADASLKAIGSRYEILRQKGLIPTDVKPVTLPASGEVKVNPVLAEWVNWVDTHIDKTKSPTDKFYFEANRALYTQGDVNRAVERLIKFAQKYPSSASALPSASLALDTYITSGKWDQTYDLAVDFQDIKVWKNSEFSKRLFSVAADAFYKKVETAYAAKDYGNTLKLSERFLKLYSKSARLPETLTLAGGAALASQDKVKADEYYSRLIAEAPQSTTVSNAYLARASIAEEKYSFRDAAHNLKEYLRTATPAPKDPNAIRRRILMLSWLSNDSLELKTALESKALCTEALASECDRYAALQGFGFASNPKVAYERAKDAPNENRAIWGALALEKMDEFGFRDRLILIRQVASHWEELDPLVKFKLLPLITKSVPAALRLNRTTIAETAPLRADEKYITRRIEAIREIENAVTKVMNLPWAEIKAQALSEAASLYADLASDLQKLPAPKGTAGPELTAYEDMIRKIVIPFEEKGNDLQGKAYEMASVFAIQQKAFQQIADPYFQANPSQSKAREKGRNNSRQKTRKVASLNTQLMDRLDSEGDWDSVDPKSKNEMKRLKGLWAQAIEQHVWQQAAFFSQEMKEKKLPEGSMGLVRAITLANAGAQAEALMELESTRRKLTPKAQLLSAEVLIDFYWAVDAKDRIQAVIKSLEGSHPEDALKLKLDFAPQVASNSPNASASTSVPEKKK
ncbi:MAG: hypothetical protein H7222_07095 [Methylotenera sp.]|nr:hypothetical protein [Oligoflexia bacterium]